MATASTLSVGDARSTSGGTNEDDQARSLEFHCNLLALFAEKATSDPDVEDSCIWTLADHQGDERSPKEQLVLAYKRSGSIEDNGGWSFLLPVSKMEDWTFDKMETTDNTSKVNKSFLTFFKIYTRLQKYPDMPDNFVNAKNVVFYLADSREVVFPGNWLVKTDIKEFIFGSALWKLREDPTIREGVVDELKIKCHMDTDLNDHDEIRTKNLGECSELKIRDFLAKLTFAFYSKTCGKLEESAKEKEISGSKGGFDHEFIHGRLMARIREKLVCGSRGRKSIQASELIEWLEELRLGERKEAFKIRFNLCDPVSDFVGRRKELRQVLYLLGGTSKEWEVGPAKKVVLSGLGGVGKSELAREYCRRHLASLYDTIAWINAESKESVAASFRELAFENLKIEKKTPSGDLKDMAEIVGETFDTLKGHRSLVVYDNAESFRQMTKYLPKESMECRMHIIFSSRSREWDDLPLIPLEYFHEKEALDLVKGCLGHLYTWNEKDGLELCKALGYYPLALKQAISYIREKDILLKNEGEVFSIPEYLKLLESNTELTLDHPFSGEIDGDYAETTYKVIMGTLQHLRKSLSGQIASVVLDVLSYLSADCIDVDVMLDANPKYRGKTLEMAFSQLSKLSIVAINSRKARIHRLVQAVNRNRLFLLGAEVNVLRDAMTFALPMDVQHMISVWEHAKKHESLIRENPHFTKAINEKLLSADLYDHISVFCGGNLETLMIVLGPLHPAVTDLLMNMLAVHQICGQLVNDEGLVKNYFEAWRNVHGPKPPEYFITLLGYGSTLMKMGRTQESVAVFNEILVDGASVLGADSDAIQIVKCRLLAMGEECGNVAGIGSSLDDVEQWIRERSCTKRSKDKNSTRAKGIKVGAGFGKMENLNTMKDILNDISGERIPNVIYVRINYAIALCRGGHQKEAVDELQKAKESARNDFEEGDLGTIMISCHMAYILLDMGRIESAEKELDDISLPMDTSGISSVLKTYVDSLRAKILCARGKSEEAMPIIFRLCLNEAGDSINEDGLRRSMDNVMFSLNAGDYKIVSHMVRGILATLENCAGKEAIPMFFFRFLLHVSNQLSENGHKKPALVILKEAYRNLKDHVGETNIDTLQVKFLFANIYVSVGDMAAVPKGLKYLSEVRDSLSKMEVESDPIATQLLHTVTVMLNNLGMKSSAP